eukprot:350747-Chlamydomonas_euryale.AAC.11
MPVLDASSHRTAALRPPLHAARRARLIRCPCMPCAALEARIKHGGSLVRGRSFLPLVYDCRGREAPARGATWQARRAPCSPRHPASPGSAGDAVAATASRTPTWRRGSARCFRFLGLRARRPLLP